MTAEEIYNKINNIHTINMETNKSVYGEISDLYYKHKENEAVNHIQNYFKCDEDTAKEVFSIFKKNPHRLPLLK